mgnify:CR=1 FL=1
MDFKVTDLVKNVVLAGIGAAAVTTEKAKDVADELVKKVTLTGAVGSIGGEKLTVEQGKVLNEELKHNIKETLDNKKKKDASVEELLSAMTPDQIDALKELLNKAAKPQDKEAKAEAPQDEEQKAEQKENTQDE